MIFTLTARSLDYTACQERGWPVVHVTLECEVSEIVNAMERVMSSEEIAKAFSTVKREG